MKLLFILSVIFILFSQSAFADFDCEPGQYTGILSSSSNGNISGKIATLNVTESSTTFIMNLTADNVSEQWLLTGNKFTYRAFDSLNSTITKENNATWDGSVFRSNTTDAYWNIFTQEPEGINPFTLTYLYFDHKDSEDNTSLVVLLDKFVFGLVSD